VTRYISGQGAVLVPVAVALSALVWALFLRWAPARGGPLARDAQMPPRRGA